MVLNWEEEFSGLCDTYIGGQVKVKAYYERQSHHRVVVTKLECVFDDECGATYETCPLCRIAERRIPNLT